MNSPFRIMEEYNKKPRRGVKKNDRQKVDSIIIEFAFGVLAGGLQQ
jgi:hypothetical protein